MGTLGFGYKKAVAVCMMLAGLSGALSAADCTGKLFSVKIDNTLSIGDVLDNLADTCDLTIVINDEGAKKMLDKKLYYVKLKNSTLRGFLNTVLSDNDLSYTLHGNKLKISYLLTKTFKVHYIAGQRIGKSHANVTIANSQNSAGSTGGVGGGSSGGGTASKTGISIESSDEFQFWQTVKKEISRILATTGSNVANATDTTSQLGGTEGDATASAGTNIYEPIVNPEAGMITVTGTQKQINRVARYLQTLTRQIKQQVLIDVRILSVSFDNSRTTGVDWSQLYSLQNLNVQSLRMAQKNVTEYTFDKLTGIKELKYLVPPKNADDVTSGASLVQVSGNVNVTDIIKFLGTQGDVKAISSPRIMTLNNQPALISVGKELFYKIQSASTASGGGGAVAAQGELVDSVFAGILLDITPEIDARGMITLKINPSISETVNAVTSSGVTRKIPPDLIRRQLASVVKVRDGEHAILGGLITSKTGVKTNKVPLLGDIPVVGYAFKHEEKIEKVEELVIIVTPHIVKDGQSITLKDLGYTKVNEK